jgi:signal transduction histidine kinase/ActR/RegA family two-component response regulator
MSAQQPEDQPGHVEEQLRAAHARISALQAELEETNRGLLALHDELEQATRVAEDANRAKSEFISRMSHELRTPLNAVLGFAQLLARDELAGRQRESVDHILTGGRHLLDLVNEVLDIARIEAGRLPLLLEPVPVSETVREVVELLQPLADERDVRFQAHAALAGVELVRADRQRVKQILLNLASNAIKYNREGGLVLISSGRQDGAVRLSIADTGPGLTAAQLALAFEPFERVGADTTDTEGSGVGLPLARRLAEAMGGGVEAESEPGRGSIFHVLLPVAEVPADTSEAPNTAVPPPAVAVAVPGADPGGVRILYVEDNRVNQQLVQRIFQLRPEIELLLASEAGEGFERAHQERPDLILLDMHLPDESGDRTLARLRETSATAAIPVIMLSAEASPEQIERLLDAGAHSYLTKPFDIGTLLDTVDAALAGREQSAGAADR